DTAVVNIPGYFSCGLKHNNKYYCFFSKSNAPYSSASSKQFYILSAGCKIISTIPVPSEMNTYHYNLQVRNDSIINKLDHGEPSYYLDEKKQQWVNVKEVDDVIFEDKYFYV